MKLQQGTLNGMAALNGIEANYMKCMFTDIELRFTRRFMQKPLKALMLDVVIFVDVQYLSMDSQLWRNFDGDQVRGGYRI